MVGQRLAQQRRVDGLTQIEVPARRDHVQLIRKVGGPRHGGVAVAHCREGEYLRQFFF